jgi:hypothetical protein
VLGTYRKKRDDWFRVRFDDGVNLTVRLDPEHEGGAWRMEAAGRRWKAQQPKKPAAGGGGGGGGGGDDDDDDDDDDAATAADDAEADCEPTGPAEFLVYEA